MDLILALLILTLGPDEAAPPVKGEICIAGGSCQSTVGTSISVSADEVLRRFVWTSDDARTVVLGEIPEGATAVELDLDRPSGERSEETERRVVHFSLRGEESRGWPVDTEIELRRSRDEQWSWSVPAATQGEEITVHLPDGAYGMSIRGQRHRAERRRLRLDRDLRLGEITLKPLPVIGGRVTRLDGEEVRPVEGAQIVLESGELAGATNEQGSFRAELDEPLPREVLVVSPGLASRVVLFEKPLGMENDLGEIRLESGASLTLNIGRSDELRSKDLTIGLLRENERRHEHSRIGSRTLAAGDDTVQFADLPEGEYFVIVSGERELERMAVPIEMGTEHLEQEIEIRPYRLNGTVVIGDETPDGGHVEVMPWRSGPTWRARLPIDGEGKFGDVLWQTGVLSGYVKLPDVSGGLLSSQSPELGADPSTWRIRFEKRLIHGRITDAATGDGIPSAIFQLQTTVSGGRGYSNVELTPSGEYEILAWQDGIYDLIVSVPKYIPKTTTVELSEGDGSRRVDIALESGTETVLEFVWPTGQPVAGAPVFEGVARDGHNPRQIYTTDAAGRLTLRMEEGASRLLHIIPREGSFAPVRVTGKQSEGPQRIEIPAPVGLLRIRLVDSEGNPANGAVVMRYNGEWVPYSVTGRMRVVQSPGMAEFSALPAGAYEVWAIRRGSLPGRATAPHTPPAHAPVITGVAAGETTIEVIVVEGGG